MPRKKMLMMLPSCRPWMTPLPVTNSCKRTMVKPICASRPFQISAFFFIPHGPRPSLKFHLRSCRRVLPDLCCWGTRTWEGAPAALVWDDAGAQIGAKAEAMPTRTTQRKARERLKPMIFVNKCVPKCRKKTVTSFLVLPSWLVGGTLCLYVEAK